MGFDGGNQKLQYDMVKKQNNTKNQRDCDMSRVKAMKTILAHRPKCQCQRCLERPMRKMFL